MMERWMKWLQHRPLEESTHLGEVKASKDLPREDPFKEEEPYALDPNDFEEDRDESS